MYLLIISNLLLCWNTVFPLTWITLPQIILFTRILSLWLKGIDIIFCAELYGILFVSLGPYSYSLVCSQYFCTRCPFPEHVFGGVSRLSGDTSLHHGFSKRKYLKSIPLKIQQISIDCSRSFNCFKSIISPPKKVDTSKEGRAGWTYSCWFLVLRSALPRQSSQTRPYTVKPKNEPRYCCGCFLKPLMASTVLGELRGGISCTTSWSSLWGNVTEANSGNLHHPNTRWGCAGLRGGIYGNTNSQLFSTFKVIDFEKAGF